MEEEINILIINHAKFCYFKSFVEIRKKIYLLIVTHINERLQQDPKLFHTILWFLIDF